MVVISVPFAVRSEIHSAMMFSKRSQQVLMVDHHGEKVYTWTSLPYYYMSVVFEFQRIATSKFANPIAPAVELQTSAQLKTD